jgi:hypothetical protein
MIRDKIRNFYEGLTVAHAVYAEPLPLEHTPRIFVNIFTEER